MSNEDVDLLGEEYDRVFAEAREDGSFRNLAGEEPETATEMLQIMQMSREIPCRKGRSCISKTKRMSGTR